MNIHDYGNITGSCSVGGSQFDLLGVDMQFAHNAPPTVSCRVVPKGYSSAGVVDSSDAALFWSTLRTCDNAVGKENASLSLSNLPGGRDFNASGWVLGGVSVSASAIAEGPECIDLQLLHPIVALEKYPSHVGPVKVNVADASELGGSDYLGVVKSALESYKKRVTDSAKKTSAYKLLSEGIGRLGEFVKCEGCGLDKIAKLMEGFDEKAVKKGFKKYILSCIENGSDNQTIFSLAFRAIATDLSLCLYTDENDLAARTMTLKPNVPFKPDPLRVTTDSIIRMGGQHGDWLAPSGVVTTLASIVRASYNHEMPAMLDSASMSVICREGGLQTVNVDAPVWFKAMLSYVFGSTFNKPDDVPELKELDLENTKQSKALRKLLTQYFLDLYRQNRTISITRVFSLEDNGGSLIVPGKTCLLHDGKHQGMLFLVNGVNHKFSLQSNAATTEIYGTYLRAEGLDVKAEGGDPEAVITGGYSADKNYIWG